MNILDEAAEKLLGVVSQTPPTVTYLSGSALRKLKKVVFLGLLGFCVYTMYSLTHSGRADQQTCQNFRRTQVMTPADKWKKLLTEEAAVRDAYLAVAQQLCICPPPEVMRAAKLDQKSCCRKSGETSHPNRAQDLLVEERDKLPPCPSKPPYLKGRLDVTLDPVSLEVVENNHPELEEGGSYRPPNCNSPHKVAILVPYRNREKHLGVFLAHIHPILQRQLLDYTIFVVEQWGDESFNRGKLFNVGFLEAMKLRNYTCVVLHDVDLLPDNDQNLYHCPDLPMHMSAAINKFFYMLPYFQYFGGVTSMSSDHFRLINGFSNIFYGWGAEDDDLYQRVINHGLNITRLSKKVASYTMHSHSGAVPSSKRNTFLNAGAVGFKRDGLNSCIYKIVQISRPKLYTNITVDLMAKVDGYPFNLL